MYRVVAKSDKATDFPALLYSFDFVTLEAAQEAVRYFTDEDTITCQIIDDYKIKPPVITDDAVAEAVTVRDTIEREKPDEPEDRPEEPKAD